MSNAALNSFLKFRCSFNVGWEMFSRTKASHARFNNAKSHARFNNAPSHARFNNAPSHARFNNSPSHERFNNSPSHARFNNAPSHARFNNSPSHERFNDAPDGRFNNFVKKKWPKHRKIPLFEASNLELAPKLIEKPKQNFDYFLILDFEATCDSPVNLDPQEIIEFPVLKVNGDTMKVESTFHSYVRPVINPELSSFCTELTGIIQSMVDNQPEFIEVFKNFLSWLEEEELMKSNTKFAFVTCGDPDLDYLLPVQCRVSETEVPEFMKRWINVKRSFCNISPYTWPNNLSKMLEYCNLEPYGELHSGLDDAINTSRVLADLAERGLVYDFNGWKNTLIFE